MGHTYVGDAETAKFIGLVCMNSLATRDQYADWLRAKRVAGAL